MTPQFCPMGEKFFAQSTVNLSRFVLAQATAAEQLVGFGWRPQVDAPSQFNTLKRAYLASMLTGQPLPISSEHSAETIYTSAGVNEAFRFWHDVTHVRMDKGFDLSGEIAVALAHLGVLQAAGWGSGSLEYELLHADTLGQALCNELTGKFPVDQACFGRRAITTSLGKAIRSEPDLADHADDPDDGGGGGENDGKDESDAAERPAA